MRKPQYLKTLRMRRHWTQEQLEQVSHVAQNTISKLESRSTSRPAHATVCALAQALDIRPDLLLFGPDPNGWPVRRQKRAPKAEAVPA